MSGEATSETGDPETELSHDTAAWPSIRDTVGSERAVLATSALALVAVASDAVVTVLANVPFDPVVASAPVRAATGSLAPAAVAVALVAIAVTDERATVRVGLLFAAVFGCLAVLAPATTLAAVVAVVGGGALALVGGLGVPERWQYRTVRRRVLAVCFVGALALTLAGVTGLVDGLREPGALLALIGMAAVGTRAERSRLAAGAGVVAAVGIVAASVLNPFVTGSALLIAFAVTGVPHLLVALAVAGVVAATVGGLRQGKYALATGALLLVFAGVPATFPRAMALLLGAVLVIVDGPVPTGRETGVSP